MDTALQRQHEEQAAALRRLQAMQLAEARRIWRTVAHHYGFTPAQLRASGRHRKLAEARQVTMFLIHLDLRWPTRPGTVPFPLARIGALLKRDGATVGHGVGQIAAAQAMDTGLRWTLAAIRAT
jgi:chromosomal replication initiation ATPase DnaA